MPLRLSERTSNSSALPTISRFVFSRVSLRAFRTRLSSISMFVLAMLKAYTKSWECGVCCSSAETERLGYERQMDSLMTGSGLATRWFVVRDGRVSRSTDKLLIRFQARGKFPKALAVVLL